METYQLTTVSYMLIGASLAALCLGLYQMFFRQQSLYGYTLAIALALLACALFSPIVEAMIASFYPKPSSWWQWTTDGTKRLIKEYWPW